MGETLAEDDYPWHQGGRGSGGRGGKASGGRGAKARLTEAPGARLTEAPRIRGRGESSNVQKKARVLKPRRKPTEAPRANHSSKSSREFNSTIGRLIQQRHDIKDDRGVLQGNDQAVSVSSSDYGSESDSTVEEQPKPSGAEARRDSTVVEQS